MTEALAELERIVGCTKSNPRNKCACGNVFRTRLKARPIRRPEEDYVLPTEGNAKLGWCNNCGHFIVVYRGKPYDMVRDLTREEAVRLREVAWEKVRGYIDPIVERMIG